jgi:hypothetical protein
MTLNDLQRDKLVIPAGAALCAWLAWKGTA